MWAMTQRPAGQPFLTHIPPFFTNTSTSNHQLFRSIGSQLFHSFIKFLSFQIKYNVYIHLNAAKFDHFLLALTQISHINIKLCHFTLLQIRSRKLVLKFITTNTFICFPQKTSVFFTWHLCNGSISIVNKIMIVITFQIMVIYNCGLQSEVRLCLYMHQTFSLKCFSYIQMNTSKHAICIKCKKK